MLVDQDLLCGGEERWRRWEAMGGGESSEKDKGGEEGGRGDGGRGSREVKRR